jgi:hypothetical protein
LDRVRSLSIPVAATLVVIAAALGGWVAGLVTVGIAVGMVAGLRRGGAEILGWLAGLVLAALLAPPMGRSIEGAFAGVLGTGGLLNRMVSIGACGVLIAVCVGAGAAAITSRWTRSRPELARWDAWAGAAFGLLYGVTLALIGLWIPLAAAPIAQAQLRAQEEGGRSAGPFARPLVRLSERIRASGVGGLAGATNPLPGTDLFALAADFAEVSRHPGAMEHFMSSDVMRRVNELASLRQAFDMVRADPELTGMFEKQGVTVEGLVRALNSPTLLRVLDETTIAADLGPLGGEMAAAIRSSRARIPPPAPPG